MSSGMRNAGGSDRPFHTEQHEPAVLPTTDLAEVNCLGRADPARRTAAGYPGYGVTPGDRDAHWCPRLRARTASRSSNPRGPGLRLVGDPSAPGGLADRLH